MTERSLRVLLFIHVLLFALVVGVFWGTWFSLSRSIEAISAATFLEIGHTMIGNLGGSMPILMPAALLSAVPVLVALHRRHRRTSFLLALAGLGALVGALIITLGVNVPIDGDIARWTVDTLPSDWSSVRDRWETFHAARTFVSLAGFGSALAAALWSHDDVTRRV